MATVKKAQKGTKLTTKRVREVADSLEDVGYKKIAASVSGRTKPAEKLQDLTKSGWSDIDNSKRYKKLADKAESKKSMKSGGKIKCWTGYVKKGTKKKGGKTVNNCVKKK